MEGPQALLLATPDEVALAITSYLGEPRDLAHLAVAVRRFSVKAIKDPHPAAGQEAEPEEWSMVQEAARRWVAACPEAERRRVPRREGDCWLGLMHEAQALRRPLRLRGWGAQADNMLELRPLPSGTEVVKVRGSAVWSSARCDAVMRAGVHFAQFTVDEDTQRIYPRIQFDAALKMMLGVVRPTAEAGADLHHTEGHCLFYTYNGAYYPTQDAWQGKQGAQDAGDRLGLLLDLDLGALSVWKNGERLGIMATGLTGPYCWAANIFTSGDVARVESAEPPAAPTGAEVATATMWQAVHNAEENGLDWVQ